MELPTDVSEEIQFLFQNIREYLIKTTNATDNEAISDNAVEWRINLMFWEFITDTARELINNKCQKTSFNAEILSLCISMSNVRLLVKMHFSPFSDPLNQRDLQFRRIIISARMDPKELGKILVTPYKYAHTVVSQEYDVVGRVVESGDVELLELLLRFGAVPLKRLEVPIDLQEYDDDEQLNMAVNVLLYEEGFKDLSEWNIDCIRLGNLNESKRSRIFLVARVLEALGNTLLCPLDADKYIASLKLLYKSIPEPFVTSPELGDFYHTILTRNIPQERISRIRICFEAYFSDSSELPSPRSLKHLSRCEIRDSLKQAESLPTGVESLPLPRKLKDYIWLKE